MDIITLMYTWRNNLLASFIMNFFILNIIIISLTKNQFEKFVMLIKMANNCGPRIYLLEQTEYTNTTILSFS